jgi:hypothetical protein
MRWQPIFRIPAIVSDLVAGQLESKRQERTRLQADIDEVTLYPTGRLVFVVGAEPMSKDAWLADANTALAELDAQIATLEAYQQ